MVRSIVGVIVGYVAFSSVLFLLFSALYLVLGTSGSFQPGSFNLSWTWLVVSFVIFFLGAVAATFVSTLISKNESAWLQMGLTLVVIGILMAVLQIAQDPGEKVREIAEVPLFDAMQSARGPAWSYFVSPITGFLGSLLVGQIKK